METKELIKQGTVTGADFLPFDRALNEGMKLINGDNDKKRILGLYIVISINLGLRISDILTLTWEQLKMGKVVLNEKKTGKKRILMINQHIKDAVKLFDPSLNGLIFISQKKTVYRIQTINILLKEIFYKEAKSLSISTHSLRKTFARTIYEKLGCTEKALMYISEMFNHASMKITRIYMGIQQQEIDDIYNML